MVRALPFFSAVIVVAGLVVMPVEVALAEDSDCWKIRGEARILACTLIIKSGLIAGKRRHCQRKIA